MSAVMKEEPDQAQGSTEPQEEAARIIMSAISQLDENLLLTKMARVAALKVRTACPKTKISSK